MDNAAEREKASRSRFRQAGLQTRRRRTRPGRGPPRPRRPGRRRNLHPQPYPLSGRSDQRHRRRVHRRHQHPARPRYATSSRPPRRAGCTSTARCPRPAGHRVLTRTDADGRGLSPLRPRRRARPGSPAARPARRAGVMRTGAVSKVTTLLVVRYRARDHHSRLAPHRHASRRGRPVPRVHRERRHPDLVAARPKSTRCWPPTPTGNVDDALARTPVGPCTGAPGGAHQAPHRNRQQTRRRTGRPSTARSRSAAGPAAAHSPPASCHPPTCSASTCSCRKRVPDERTVRLPCRPRGRHRAARRSPRRGPTNCACQARPRTTTSCRRG